MKLVSRIGFHTVTVSKTQTTYSGWIGVEYIIVDPTKGAGTYMISGGLMGAGTACPLPKPGAYDPPGQTCPVGTPLSIYSPFDISALITVEMRRWVVSTALSQLGSPYVYYGDSPDCGFDCSGLVFYAFNTVYGNPPISYDNFRTVALQLSTCYQKGWVHPINEALIGDILWLYSAHGVDHTGIFFGQGWVIQAQGAPCKDPNDPKGIIYPCDPNQTPICGQFARVVITPLSRWSAVLAPDICRPMPY